MISLDYEKINRAVLEVYQKTNTLSFPIDCLDIFSNYGLSVYPYSELDKKTRDCCLILSEDSLIYKNKICYNDSLKRPYGRIRFSLMHELGHYVLNHSLNRTIDDEKEADYFATYILAPRIAIKYSECKNELDVANIFMLSYEASKYAFNDYLKWKNQCNYIKSDVDDLIYKHFFNTDYNGFVWHFYKCEFCKEITYNKRTNYCEFCIKKRNPQKLSNASRIFKKPYQEENAKDFLIAEHNWLYGNDL